jgi:hypothetical protein
MTSEVLTVLLFQTPVTLLEGSPPSSDESLVGD